MLAELPSFWLWTVVVLWGAVWGSFANVVIARVPYGRSVSLPASHCPSCETPLAWYDNIPLLSWLLLRGRCRSCRAPISAQYPLVELGGIASSVLAAFLAAGGVSLWRLAETPPIQVLSVWMLLSYFLLLLMILSVIDLRHLLLPHRLTGMLAILALIYAIAGPFGGDWRGFVPQVSVWSAVTGFLVGYGTLYIFAMAYQLIRGRQGIGGGDFMLFGALGAWFGWEALPLIMLLAALQGVLAFALAMLFFPSLIQRVEDEGFWDATTAEAPSAGGGSASSPAGEEASPDATTAEAPSTGGESASAPADEEASPDAAQALGRGIPFGPFLCLAAVEYLVFGGFYLAWLGGSL